METHVWMLMVSLIVWDSNGQSQSNEICVLVKYCPSALDIFRDPSRKEDWRDLEKKICGQDGRYPKIWCNVPCVTPDNENGICTPIKQCTGYINLVQNSNLDDASINAYLRNFSCITSTFDEIHVCCMDTKTTVKPKPPTEATTKTPISHLPIVQPPETCGVQVDQYKIVGGNIANIGEYPWLVLLQYLNKEKLSPGCGGTLLSKRYVLTAAHCVDEYSGNLVNIILGEHNLTSEIDCFHTFCAPAAITVKVDKVIPHPDWLNAKNRFYNDIALVRLADEVAFSEFVQPICLPAPDFGVQQSDAFVVAGWGRTEAGTGSEVKRYASIRLQDQHFCLNTIRLPLSDGQICVGGASADSCKGDSGGPLMRVDNIAGKLIWHLMGVVSLGYNSPCGSIAKPGIYTYVPKYTQWIRTAMEEE